MNRKSFLQRGAAGAAVGVSGLIVPTVAEAGHRMGPKFASTLKLARNGSHVYAHGPLGAHDEPTYVAVILMQNGHFAHGISRRYSVRHDDQWTAVAWVDSHRLHVGPAMAHGVQVLPESEEVYTYNWSMPVHLVH